MCTRVFVCFCVQEEEEEKGVRCLAVRIPQNQSEAKKSAAVTIVVRSDKKTQKNKGTMQPEDVGDVCTYQCARVCARARVCVWGGRGLPVP